MPVWHVCVTFQFGGFFSFALISFSRVGVREELQFNLIRSVGNFMIVASSKLLFGSTLFLLDIKIMSAIKPLIYIYTEQAIEVPLLFISRQKKENFLIKVMMRFEKIKN